METDRGLFISKKSPRSSQWHRVSLLVLVLSVIPQGSVLRSLLFICFIKDMPEVVYSSIHMFADDTKIFRTVNNPEQAQLLQDDLNALEEWSNL